MKGLVLAALISSSLVPTAAYALPQRGAPVAPIDLPTASGSTVSLAALRGKPVYLSFFATWCGPCNDEAPMLQAVAKKYQSAGLTVIGIDEEESSAKAQRFASEYGLTFPIALDRNGSVGDDLGVYATPTNVFIDRDGHVSSVVVGEMSGAEIDAALKKLL